MIQGNPDFLAKLMAELEAEKALSVGANDLVQMPQSMIGMQAPEGGMNQQALQQSLQGQGGNMVADMMSGNVPDPSAPINNIPQELSNMGYTPPPAQTGQMQEMLGKVASFTPETIEHHPLVQSTAQYVPLPTSEFNPYAPVNGELGLMELLAQSQQMG